jgi:hypothetical protein
MELSDIIESRTLDEIAISRADNLRTRLASAAVAVLLAHARGQAPATAVAAE